MTSPPLPVGRKVLAICDGAMVPADWADGAWEQLAIRTSGDGDRLNLRAESLTGHVFGPIEHRANDLIRIAAYAYAVDQQVSRGGDRDPQRREWRRQLALCIPVADPIFWMEPTVRSALTEALRFGTEDTWQVAFSPARAELRQVALHLEDPPLPADDRPTAAILLSGGLDSLCATVEAVAAQGHRPVLVSHRSAPNHDQQQRALVAALRQRFPAWTFPHLSFWIHQRGPEAAERTRRSRGFLVAALGAAVAGQFGLPRVLLADNGYVSINPPINDQLVGALTSRGTHPAFLRLVNRLTDLVFPAGCQVTNSLAERTRAEALAILREHACLDFIPLTRSCAMSRLRKETPHCGVCSQCVDRRFATVAAGLEVYDPPERYRTDVFTAALPSGIPRTLVRSYAGFAQRVVMMDDETLLTELPELEACIDLEAPQVSLAARRITAVVRRHADDVLAALRVELARHADALVRRQLPDDCLLTVVIQPPPSGSADDVPVPVPPDESAGEAATGIVPTDLLGPADDTTPRCHRVDSAWYISYDEERGLVPQSVGMHRLARLLKAPGQELHAIDLVTGSSPGKRPAAGSEDALRAPGDLGATYDATALAEFDTRIQQIQAELAELDAMGEEPERLRLWDELEQLLEIRDASRGKGGRPRPLADEHERARQTVGKTIGQVRESFAPRMPRLYQHLHESLQLGFDCCYDPRPRRRWDVRL